MTLSDFATFCTALSGPAVTASLVYLALQTHQASKHTRALINQGRVALVADLCLAATDADLAAALIFSRGGEATPEAVKRLQYRYWVTAAVNGWQDSFAQHERGLLDPDIHLQMRAAMTRGFAQPALRAEWEAIKVPGSQFSAFVDGIIASLPLSAEPPRDPGQARTVLN